MKGFVSILLSFLLIGSAEAFHLPRSVYTMENLKAARSKAIASKRPLVFLVSNPKARNDACAKTSSSAIGQLGLIGVIVFVDFTEKDIFQKIPHGAQLGWQSLERRNIPFALITSQDGHSSINTISYAQMRQGLNPAVMAVRKTIQDNPQLLVSRGIYRPGGNAVGQTKAPIKPWFKPKKKARDTPVPEFSQWTNYRDKTIRAKLIGWDELDVVFEMEDGRVLDYPKAKLSTPSRERVPDY